MDNLVEDNEQEGVLLEEQEGSHLEKLLRAVIQGYQEAWTKHNKEYELKYYLTITNQKIPTPQGNKNVAYLRLEKAIRKLEEEQWSTQLVHTELYVFKNIAERTDPKAPWKDQLWLNCISRLISAGLEYGELLQRMKTANLEEMKKQEELASEPKIIITDQMPQPLNQKEEEYKDWVNKNNEHAIN